MSAAKIWNDDALRRLRAASPAALFAEWFADAAAVMPEPEAAALATVAADGTPQARTVLVKSFSAGRFVFFTNSESRKGESLRQNPRAAILFYWRELGRQVKIEGATAMISRRRTAAYFASRPLQSRLGALASAQSRPIESFSAFAEKVRAAEDKYDENTPPPPHWNGYALTPLRMEFWRAGDYRWHQRLAFSRAAPGHKWRAAVLQP